MTTNPAGNGCLCECSAGWFGSSCERGCDASPCKNGGSCSTGDEDYICTCPIGFGGSDCELTIDLEEADLAGASEQSGAAGSSSQATAGGTGLVVGIVVGVLLVIVLVGLAIVSRRRSRSRHDRETLRSNFVRSESRKSARGEYVNPMFAKKDTSAPIDNPLFVAPSSQSVNPAYGSFTKQRPISLNGAYEESSVMTSSSFTAEYANNSTDIVVGVDDRSVFVDEERGFENPSYETSLPPQASEEETYAVATPTAAAIAPGTVQLSGLVSGLESRSDATGGTISRAKGAYMNSMLLDIPLFSAEPLSRREAEMRLSSESPGAYLVRSKGALDLVISVALARNEQGTAMYIHHLLKRDGPNDVWTVNGNPLDGSHRDAQDFVRHLVSMGNSWTEQPLSSYIGQGESYVEPAIEPGTLADEILAPEYLVVQPGEEDLSGPGPVDQTAVRDLHDGYLAVDDHSVFETAEEMEMRVREEEEEEEEEEEYLLEDLAAMDEMI